MPPSITRNCRRPPVQILPARGGAESYLTLDGRRLRRAIEKDYDFMTSLLKDLRSDDEGSFLGCRHGTSELARTEAYALGSDREPEPDGFEAMDPDAVHVRPGKQLVTGADSTGAVPA